LWSQRFGSHPMRSSTWRLWVSYLLNSRSWRSGAHGLSSLSRGCATCSLGHHPVWPDWPIIWTRPPDSLGRSWLHDRGVDHELEALRTSDARVWDLMLDNADMSSSLAASMSTAVELLERRIDDTTTNGVRSWTRSALVAAMSHFQEPKSELELLGSGL
jgi:hypothetical protein